MGVVVFVGLLDVDSFFFVVDVAEGGEVAVAFVDGISFGGDGGVSVAVKLLQVGHRHCFSEKYYTTIIENITYHALKIVQASTPSW